ncbi:MAG: DoxX family protein [Paludibacteraceae bacterium]|nr:DoxX family protein [Paludibacteraceae bacterium]
MNDSIKRIIVVVSRILLGLVFVFSGFAKLVDPLGSTYKIQDYLSAMGLDFFAPIALVMGIALATFEFTLGVCLLLGTNIKSTSILSLLMMGFMTPLTLWIAIADPVSDCGCFGDALVISNWQTFWKNIVLSTLAILIFIWRKHSPKLFTERTDWLIAICAGTFSVLLSIYCLLNLPVIDFRPYKNGTNIIQSMEVPEGAEEDEFETLLVYEKDGVQKEFTLENYPKDDNSWTFVDSKNKLIKKGYEPPIHDFSMEHPDMGDITEEVLQNEGYSFLMVCYRVEKAATNKKNEINNIYDFAKQNGYGFYCMTATGLETEEMREFQNEMEWGKDGDGYPFVNSDEITLKTIVRSNPGLVLIKDGVVINKWSNKNMPTFTEPLENTVRGQVQKANEWKVVFKSLLAFLATLALVFAIDWIISKVMGKNKKD